MYIHTSKNLSNNFYQENKERLQKKLVKDIRIFLKKGGETRQYSHQQYKNLPEDEKQKLVENKKKDYSKYFNLENFASL